uniref:Uncharacterized protein n=1 Tax=Arundo donax TaxID=35708 RepID=A0A0A9HUP5_ARUDO
MPSHADWRMVTVVLALSLLQIKGDGSEPERSDPDGGATNHGPGHMPPQACDWCHCEDYSFCMFDWK